MTSSKEHKSSNVQKKICSGNCQPRARSPCSCLVVQNNWNELDGRRRTMTSGRTEGLQSADKNRKLIANEALSSQSAADSAQLMPGQKSPGGHSPKRQSDVKLRLNGEEILLSHGQTGPAEIGPGKHRPTKTSELRTQWMRGGYSLSKDSKKHLKEFNRLPFVSCGKESTCVELVTDRVQRVNHERKETMQREAHAKAVEAAERERSESVESITTKAHAVEPTAPVTLAETPDIATDSSATTVADTPASEPAAETSGTVPIQSADSSTDAASIPADAEQSNPPSVGFTTGILAAAFSFSRPPPANDERTNGSTAPESQTTPSRSTTAAKDSRA